MSVSLARVLVILKNASYNNEIFLVIFLIEKSYMFTFRTTHASATNPGGGWSGAMPE